MILHISTCVKWEKAISLGTYRDKSLEDEGFIHCSTPEQILGSANKHYFGQTGLILLCISPSLLKAPLVYEDIYNRGEEFPHIYGQLNLDAVTKVFDLLHNRDGSFYLPEDFDDPRQQIDDVTDFHKLGPDSGLSS